MANFNFSNKYTYNELLDELKNKDYPLEEWVKVMSRLYTETDINSTPGQYSFFAREINQFRQHRLYAERWTQVGISTVMITALLLPAVTLSAASIIGSAALSLTLLNGIYNTMNFADLNPKINFSQTPLTLDESVRDQWERYRQRWCQRLESHELTESNQHKQSIVKVLATTTVLTFSAGIALFSQAASIALILSLAAYASALLLSLNSNNAPLIEKCDQLPPLTTATN